MKKIFLLLALIALFFGCKNEQAQTKSNSILTTTSILGDIIRNMVPEEIEVINLMGPGTDPHLYKASPSDYVHIREAQFIVLSGLHLEGKMAEVILGLDGEKKVKELTSSMTTEQIINSDGFADGHDPHVWMDVEIVRWCVLKLKTDLIKWFPEHRKAINERSEAYILKLGRLNREVLSILNEVPAERRIIVTSHDALNYFARAYQYEVRSLQGFSTAAEFGLKDVTALVDFIIDRKVPAIFVENIVSDQALKAVQAACQERGFEVALGGSLFTDALGNENTKANTYEGMIRANAITISHALKN
jgi:manganese/zinc/iron transport system substrate-binding protein